MLSASLADVSNGVTVNGSTVNGSPCGPVPTGISPAAHAGMFGPSPARCAFCPSCPSCDVTPALRAAGLPHDRLYDLRNTTATWMLDAGVPAPNVAEMLGTSVAQLEDTYNRPTDEALSR